MKHFVRAPDAPRVAPDRRTAVKSQQRIRTSRPSRARQRGDTHQVAEGSGTILAQAVLYDSSYVCRDASGNTPVKSGAETVVAGRCSGLGNTDQKGDLYVHKNRKRGISRCGSASSPIRAPRRAGRRSEVHDRRRQHDRSSRHADDAPGRRLWQPRFQFLGRRAHLGLVPFHPVQPASRLPPTTVRSRAEQNTYSCSFVGNVDATAEAHTRTP